ncbi:hypothetical protein Tco_1414099 [Tanacetum coccineum]
MNPEEKLKANDGTSRVNERLYRSLIGRLIYVTHSRPDLSFTIGVLSRDNGGSVDDGINTTGNCFMLGSGAISWSSKKQETTVISAMEAKYIVATATSCQAVWLRRLMSDLGMKQLKET